MADKELIESGAEDTWSEEEELNGIVKKRERFEKLKKIVRSNKLSIKSFS